MHPILILANQFPHVLAAGAVAALRNLIVDKRFERIGQGDIHGAHGPRLDDLANFGKIVLGSNRIALCFIRARLTIDQRYI